MEDRPTLFDDTPRLSDTQADDVVAYRPVNALAVLGLVLALTSVLALASPWFAWLPVLAAVLCYLGRRAVVRDPDAQTGRGVATVGLALAVALAVAVPVRQRVEQHLHAEAARPIAERFMACLAANDLVGAYELTLPYDLRRPSAELAAAYYDSDESAKERLQAFREKPGLERALGIDEAPALFDRSVVKPRKGALFASWVYALPDAPEAPESEREVLSLRLERPFGSHRGRAIGWRVADLRVAPRGS